MIIAETFKAFYTGNTNLIPHEVRIAAVCNALGITHTELIKQPAWWVDSYQLFLEGKNKAEAEKAKIKHPYPKVQQRGRINRIR